jgi:hypothetical protein
MSSPASNPDQSRVRYGYSYVPVPGETPPDSQKMIEESKRFFDWMKELEREGKTTTIVYNDPYIVRRTPADHTIPPTESSHQQPN